MEILVEKQEEFPTAGYVVLLKIKPVSHTKFVQFCAKPKHCKNWLVVSDQRSMVLNLVFERRGDVNFQ